MRCSTLLLALTGLLALTALAGAAEPKVVIGQAKPSWQKLPGVDGREHALADLKEREVVIVAITCNHCPIVIEYYDRMKAFVEAQGKESKVALVAISLSDLETDRLPRMKEMSERKGFNFAYLHDASQRVGKELGATNTPQFFVLDRERVLVYRGAWDDNVNEAKVSQRYVADAVAALLAGKSPPVAETKAKGCLIDYQE